MAKKVWKITKHYNGWMGDKYLVLPPDTEVEGEVGAFVAKSWPDGVEPVSVAVQKAEAEDAAEAKAEAEAEAAAAAKADEKK